MRVKMVSRDEEAHTRERPEDVRKVQRNPSSSEHPLAEATEYKRAVNASKLDKIFAKPFVSSLSGHSDGVTSLARSNSKLTRVLTGAGDGDVRLWDTTSARTLMRLTGHEGIVRGVSFTNTGESAVTCGDDGTIRIFNVQEEGALGLKGEPAGVLPRETRQVNEAPRALDHHRRDSTFSTANESLKLWTHARDEPILQFEWGSDTIYDVRFNPAEGSLLGTCASDRSVTLFDTRTKTPLRKVVMLNRSNKISWNPREPFNFVTANEDGNAYSFDMRKLDRAQNVHRGFVSAVTCIDFSPTGRFFVAGSFDRTVRIFPHTSRHSTEVYHTRRMQRISQVTYTGDSSYIVSASDEGNARVWKHNASEQQGETLPREKRKFQYNNALLRRHAHVPEVRRIRQQRRVPRPVHKAAKKRQEMERAQSRKEENIARHSKHSSKRRATLKEERVLGLEE